MLKEYKHIVQQYWVLNQFFLTFLACDNYEKMLVGAPCHVSHVWDQQQLTSHWLGLSHIMETDVLVLLRK